MASVVTAITSVFTAIGDWIIQYIPKVIDIFYSSSDNSLTFLGVLAVLALGVSIFFLIMGLIQNFLHFRG